MKRVFIPRTAICEAAQLSVITSALTLIITFTMTAKADDYIAPDLVKVTTPLYKPKGASYKPRLGTYEYSVGWEGISAASCSVTVREKGGQYLIDAAARTYSGVDLLYKLRYEARGVLEGSDLSSVSLSIDHRENSRYKNIELAFEPHSKSVSAIRQKGLDDPDKQSVSFTPNNPTIDPIGAAFLARTLEWQIGESKHFDVFNGRSRYFITLTAVKRTTINFQGAPRNVFVISPQVRNLTTTKPRSKLREAFIYITDDEQRDILRIESSVFIGMVTVEMDSFTPAVDTRPSLTTVAQRDSSSDARAQMR